MASASLSAESRSETGKGVARKLRAAGRVPGVVYGHGREPQSLSLNARELEKLLGSIAAGSTVVELSLGNATTNTLIREVQRHPFKKQILHVDFMELVAGEKVIVAPDVGSAKMARGFAKRLDASLAIIDKRRPRANVSEVVNVVGEVEGRDCILADDMIDTAGTVTEAARALKGLGARDIYVCATHALLSGPAVERLSSSPIKEVVVTDTILVPEQRRFDKLTILSVGELLSKAIRYTHAEQSVSSLFD